MAKMKKIIPIGLGLVVLAVGGVLLFNHANETVFEKDQWLISYKKLFSDSQCHQGGFLRECAFTSDEACFAAVEPLVDSCAQNNSAEYFDVMSRNAAASFAKVIGGCVGGAVDKDDGTLNYNKECFKALAKLPSPEVSGEQMARLRTLPLMQAFWDKDPASHGPISILLRVPPERPTDFGNISDAILNTTLDDALSRAHDNAAILAYFKSLTSDNAKDIAQCEKRVDANLFNDPAIAEKQIALYKSVDLSTPPLAMDEEDKKYQALIGTLPDDLKSKLTGDVAVPTSEALCDFFAISGESVEHFSPEDQVTAARAWLYFFHSRE